LNISVFVSTALLLIFWLALPCITVIYLIFCTDDHSWLSWSRLVAKLLLVDLSNQVVHKSVDVVVVLRTRIVVVHAVLLGESICILVTYAAFILEVTLVSDEDLHNIGISMLSD